MRKINDFENVQENSGGDFEKLPAGGYICKIKSVSDVPEKEYLKIEFDIADGKYKNWYADINKRTSKWYGNFIRSYKESATGFFKGFITAIEESNPGYKWNWQEQTLVGKWVGLVIAYEEYLNNDGDVRQRTYVAQNRSGQKIKAGDFTVPELKKLKQATKSSPSARPGFDAMDMKEIDEDMPF